MLSYAPPPLLLEGGQPTHHGYHFFIILHIISIFNKCLFFENRFQIFGLCVNYGGATVLRQNIFFKNMGATL